jgi:hypothetical protein
LIKRLKNSRKVTLTINQNTTDMKRQMDEHRQNVHHQAVTDWLSPSRYPAQLADILSRRQSGTAQWFLHDVKFKTWKETPNSTLFCPGIPGAGKTMMAASIIDHLISTNAGAEDIAVAYVFCNYKSQDDQSVDQLLAAILKQLIENMKQLPEAVSRSYSESASKGLKPTAESLLNILKQALETFKSVYVVIDALDECSENHNVRQKLIKCLNSLQINSDIRLAITSRFIPDIVEDLNETPQLEVKASKEDVCKFIQGQICHLPKFIQRDPSMQNWIEDRIADAVDGM